MTASRTTDLGKVIEVADHVFAYVQEDGGWWINNTGFVVGGNDVLSVDTCATERRTLAYLSAIESTVGQPVTTVVNTHHHGDHTNGNSLVPDATMICHEQARRHLAASEIGGKSDIFGTVDWGRVERRLPMVTFSERATAHVGDTRIDLIHPGGPAHTDGDAMVWIPDRSVLFAGDLIFNGGTPFVLMGSISGSLDALERIRALQPEVIVPGHGPICDVEVLEETAEYLRFVQDAARDGLASDMTPLDTARQLDLGRFADLGESERIVGNLHRAYVEAGDEGPDVDLGTAYREMVLYNDSQKLTSSV